MRASKLLGVVLFTGACVACGPPSVRQSLREVGGADGFGPTAIRLIEIYSADRDEPYAPLLRPSGVAVAPGGIFYLSDAGTGDIHIFEANGSYFGSCDSPRRGQVLPLDLATLGFHLYVLDGARRRILRYNEEGAERGVLLDLNQLDEQNAIDPVAMAADRDGRIAICDAASDRVIIVEPFLAFQQEIGELGRLPGQLDDPRGVCFGRDGALYVADRGNRRIQVFERSGLHLRTTQAIGGANDDFVAPTDVASDRFGNIYVADPGRSAVVILSPELEVLDVLGEDEMADDDLRRPVRCAVSDDDLLFVVDLGRNALMVFALEFAE
jgi:DNA-binding beta-propeller fold protein YncE